MNDVKRIQQFIVLYLQLQPKPADAQIHALAAALGCDKETLESIIYRMLAQTSEVQTAAFHRLRATADIEDVLTDQIPDESIPLDDAGTNDGLTDADIDDGMQAETYDDGTDDADIGIGQDSGDTRDVLTDDGIPVVEV